MVRRGVGVLTVVLFSSLLVASVAEAKVYFSGVPAVTGSGATVSAYVAGCAAAPSCGPLVRDVPVYLSRVRPGPMNFSALPRPRWLLGRVSATGKLAFTIPHVAAGRYRLIARMTFGGSTVPQYLPASRVFMVRAA